MIIYRYFENQQLKNFTFKNSKGRKHEIENAKGLMDYWCVIVDYMKYSVTLSKVHVGFNFTALAVYAGFYLISICFFLQPFQINNSRCCARECHYMTIINPHKSSVTRALFGFSTYSEELLVNAKDCQQQSSV